LYFAILLSCAIFDLITSTLRPRVRLQIAAVLIILAIWNFQHLSPLAYGNPWTKSKCKQAKWVKTWDFSCEEFYDNYSQYDGLGAATPQKSVAPILSTIGGDGRVPVVVEQKVQDAADKPMTSVVLGKAEPGRDIFAGEAVKKAKSDTLVVDRKEAPLEVDKEISSVVTLLATTTPGSQSNEMGKKEDHPESRKSSETSTAASTAQDSLTKEKIAGKKKAGIAEPPDAAAAHGPLGEAEAAAQKVAEELFPDAA